MTFRKEHNYQSLAFEEFYALRAKSIPVEEIFNILAKNYHKSAHTIQKWYRYFDWPKRASERDIEIRRKVAERVEDTLESTIIIQRQIVKATLKEYVEKLKEHKVKVDADTMRKLLEHQLVLYGYNPYRPQIQVFNNTNIQSILDRAGISEGGRIEALNILESEFSGLVGEKEDESREK